MRKLYRFISTILVLSLVFCAVPPAYATSVFAGGNGSENDPYRIKTVDQLNEIRYYLDKHFIQIASIDMTAATSEGGDYYDNGAGWLPIGTSSTPFTGSFNGNGFTITGLTLDGLTATQEVGLFGASSGNLINISLIDTDIQANSTSLKVGGIVGALLGDGTVKNCTVSGTISATATTYTSYVGGIVGASTGSASNGRLISGCTNQASITTKTNTTSNYSYLYTGGVLGYHSGTTLALTDCENQGTLLVQGSADIHTGGILGGQYGSGLDMDFCHNSGAIDVSYVSVTTDTPAYYTGGIIGSMEMRVSNPNGTTVLLNRTFNDGDISVKAATTNLYSMTGGIVGYATNSTYDCRITNSYNIGAVTAAGSAYYTDVGGICGENGDVPIANVYNIGAVSGKTSKNNAPNVGALVGYNAALLSNSFWNINSAQTVNDTSRSNTAKSAVGNTTSTEIDNVVSMSPLAMKSVDFVNTLNEQSGNTEIWCIDENQNSGYPIFLTSNSDPGDNPSPLQYHINSITVCNENGISLSTIPVGSSFVTVSITNLASKNNALVFIAAYTSDGQCQGLLWVGLEDVPVGSTIRFTLPLDNSSGQIANLKAFSIASFSDLTPLGNTVSFLP